MTQLVKTIIICEHRKETLLGYIAPIYRGDWVYNLRCDECGRFRRVTHRQAESARVRGKAATTAREEQAMETLYPFGKDDT